MLDDEFWSKVCKIFDIDSLPLLLMEEEYDSDATDCSEAEMKICAERTGRGNTYFLKSYEDFENGTFSQNVLLGSRRTSLGGIRDEAGCFEDLQEAVASKPKPTIDGFVSCFKKFKRSTLVQLHLQLGEYLKKDEEDFKNFQEDKEWYKKFKLTNEERKDSLQFLRKLSKTYNK